MELPAYLSSEEIAEQVTRALAEDIGPGDLTASLIPEHAGSSARLITREPAVIAGTHWANEVFTQLDPAIEVEWKVEDGDKLEADSVIATLSGPSRAILSGERTAMNFLQTLSGTATATHEYVMAVEGTGVKILDTRKTLPGLRKAQKYAVLCGGGHNHRVGLYDAILIKENHILAAGSIRNAVDQVKALMTEVLVEVEVETLEELRQALDAGVKRLLLDNMDNDTMKQAVAITAGRAELEASGGVSMDGLRAIAETGVDYISIGSLTKHVRAVDLSMRFTA
ncbi:MAG: carboxylating nicotinate-nucleotide diphosphorylase [Gammaproteobacteria bacterium]|nr:carboxylating nicotinate-nucleotide diphosphorylase [Gammaproteobacteria bacterium]